MAARPYGVMSAERVQSFAQVVAALPSVTHIARLELHAADGRCVGVIENRPGSAGSVAVYYAVTRPAGRLDRAAAEQALQLYAEYTADARAHPGRHPNIDRLIELLDSGDSLRVHAIGA